jgi:hypothetical protein
MAPYDGGMSRLVRAVVLVTALAMAGCGGDSSDQPATSADGETAAIPERPSVDDLERFTGESWPQLSAEGKRRVATVCKAAEARKASNDVYSRPYQRVQELDTSVLVSELESRMANANVRRAQLANICSAAVSAVSGSAAVTVEVRAVQGAKPSRRFEGELWDAQRADVVLTGVVKPPSTETRIYQDDGASTGWKSLQDVELRSGGDSAFLWSFTLATTASSSSAEAPAASPPASSSASR